MKRGISSIMGSLLLVLAASILIGIVFLWIRGSFSEISRQSMAEQLCNKIKFDVEDFCFEQISIENVVTDQIETKQRIRFNGENSASDSEIEGFLLSLGYEGRTIPISTLPYSELHGGDIRTLFTEFIEDINNIIEIKVLPKTRSQRGIFVCHNQERTIPGDSIQNC